MQRSVLLIFILLYGSSLTAQSSGTGNVNHNTPANARFTGKYEIAGTVLQFGLKQSELMLIVPGAPVQELRRAGKNEFKSRDFKDVRFTFIEENGEVTEVISQEPRGTFRGKKISDKVEFLSQAMDSLLLFRKSTEHFYFMYSAGDSLAVDSIATKMENDYRRILNDFGLRKIPTVTVRIYPDLQSFHSGINLPNGPDEVLGTAFGKDDLRIVSPANAGGASWMWRYAAPHEFTHCVHLNIDYSPNNPRWLWEAVAQYEAGWFFHPKDVGITAKQEFPALKNINNGMEYMLGYVIIEAITDLWGFDKVVRLIKKRGDTRKVLNIDEARFWEMIASQVCKKYLESPSDL